MSNFKKVFALKTLKPFLQNNRYRAIVQMKLKSKESLTKDQKLNHYNLKYYVCNKQQKVISRATKIKLSINNKVRN